MTNSKLKGEHGEKKIPTKKPMLPAKTVSSNPKALGWNEPSPEQTVPQGKGK